MSALAILVGVVAGLGAVAFRALIALFHNLMFLRKLSIVYDASLHTPAGPWGPLVIAVPVVGAAGVVFLVKNFAPEAKGHGVPEVMDAVYHRKGVIRPVVSLIKALASALSIGSGGSIGREGPIIQIGSSFGSAVGQFSKIPPCQTITLIAAGAGGGIAATFNTPVGGILFAVEIVMHEFSVRTLVPVALATATATYIGRLFFGTHPSFFIPKLETPFFELARPLVLLGYVGLGVMTGLVSAAFIWSIYAFEEFFEKRVKGGYYVQHMTGMLITGLLMYGFLAGFHHYYVEGVGYATIQDVLSHIQFPIYFLVLLFAGKLLATSLTLGSGASGGVFSPSLFLGAISGATWGVMLNHVLPSLNVSPVAFAIAGMGGVVSGATAAAVAAIVMIFEMTRDYNVILPLTLTVTVSYGVRRLLIQDSIYTRKLTLRGEAVPDALRANVHFSRHARDVMRPLKPEEAAAWSAPTATGDRRIWVSPDDPMACVIAGLRAGGASVALVSVDHQHPDPGHAAGVITREDVVDLLAGDLEMFED